MFGPFSTSLTNLAVGLATLGVAAGALGFVVLGLMNMWGILDPRMGQAVKGGLLRICLTLVFLGIGAGIPGIAQAIATNGGG